MTDRPIIFSAPMVRALLDGRKTQTRRVLKPQPPSGKEKCWLMHGSRDVWRWSALPETGYHDQRMPYALGDRLWVRETWGMNHAGYDVPAPIPKCRPPRDKLRDDQLVYFADELDAEITCEMPRRPSIHMPRWASRLTLFVTAVRVERLQDISRDDAIAEGCESPLIGTEAPQPGPGVFLADERTSFARLWNRIHGDAAWSANPWVVAISFTVEERNIDA